MKVILTEKVRTLGNVGEIVNVTAGYARNFLFPQNVAVLADEKNEKKLTQQKKMLAKKMNEEKAAAEALAKEVSKVKIEMIKKVGSNGRLFGTVTSTELSKELMSRDLDVAKRQITIETPIKTVGTFEIKAKLFSGVEATFTVKVDMDPKQAEEEAKKAEAAAKRKVENAKKEAEAAAAKNAEGAEGEEAKTEETVEA